MVILHIHILIKGVHCHIKLIKAQSTPALYLHMAVSLLIKQVNLNLSRQSAKFGISCDFQALAINSDAAVSELPQKILWF